MSKGQTVISVEGLSKQYRLGLIGTGTLSHDLNRWWAALRGKEDPYLAVGEVNRRDESDDVRTNDYVWALQDINFEVKQGEVLGIVGKNGAGKSTLLKILSRVTGPTHGSLKVKGGIASLLEVGTGFHPELTGKENIFLNGAILGMSKQEIRGKLDEIVEFSGVSKYLDTPVKRYSSGMYVRLAFAVAAHLEPEILVIDEVLAVGDADFQRKCLGKMKDIAGAGRTVLFVSHNMASISNLCDRILVLKDGIIKYDGEVEEGISRYLDIGNLPTCSANLENAVDLRTGPGSFSKLTFVETRDERGAPCGIFKMGSSLKINLGFKLFEDLRGIELGFCFVNSRGTYYGAFLSVWEGFETTFNEGEHSVEIDVPEMYLMPGIYTIEIWIKKEGESNDDRIDHPINFEVIPDNFTGHRTYFDRYTAYGTFHRSKWKLLAGE